MTIYAYSRTTDLESSSSEALEAQLESEQLAIQTYCLSQGWFLTANLNDRACSWQTPLQERPKGHVLLQALQAGDAVVCANLERLCSSSVELLQLVTTLRALEVGLHVVDLGFDVLNSEMSLSFENAAAVFASLEARRAKERIRGVKQKQRTKGRYLGGSRPFGYTVHENGRLVENPSEQRALSKILELKRQGKSLRAIAAAVSTPMTPISFKTVQRVLQRIE